MGWSLISTLCLHSRVSPTRPLTLTVCRTRAAIVEKFTFADEEWDCWLGPHQYRRSSERGGEDRTSRNPGCPTDVRTAGIAGGHCNSDLAGVEGRPEPNTFQG